MAFYKGLVPLRDVLADLYPSDGLARVAVAEAGILVEHVDFGGPAIRFWQSILSVAQNNNQVQGVIDVARKHFPKNERLLDAAAAFHAAPIPDPATDQSDRSGENAREGARNVSIGRDNIGIIARDISNARVVNAGHITGNGNAVVAGNDNVVKQAHDTNVAQAGPGGSATINDQSNHHLFDQRGQKVAAQYNVVGDLQDRAVAIDELRKLLEEINQARAAGELDDGDQ